MGHITVRSADSDDADGIARVCADGWRDTYKALIPQSGSRRSSPSTTPERIRAEVRAPQGWDGWLVAIDEGTVVGAGGGGMTEPHAGEIFVLYLDPLRRREGIATLLLDRITQL